MMTGPKIICRILFILWLFCFESGSICSALEIRQLVPDTGQNRCYNHFGPVPFPKAGSRFFGQDAHYRTNPMIYRDNGDGTILDLVTGLMWTKTVDTEKLSLLEAEKMAGEIRIGGHSDWRVPHIKELYSLINFCGDTGSGNHQSATGPPSDAIPFINTDYFDFLYGDTSRSERYIDAQWLSCTRYVSTTMNGAKTLFGVNFADGRIKGYGYRHPNRPSHEKKFYVRFVRGNRYGENDFQDNHDGTITDRSTGLMWTKSDSAGGMDWESALKYAETASVAGYTDWRLPDAKELQYIVDYTRSPDTTDSPAIDPVFDVSEITNESAQKDYPYFWTSTTHNEGRKPVSCAVYISFGRGMGQRRGVNMDVHGAGCQRSDPKSGRGNISRGPQGDWVRVKNYVRLVRGGSVTLQSGPAPQKSSSYPHTIRIGNNRQKPVLNSPGAPRTDSKDGLQHSQTNKTDRPRGPEHFIRRLDRDGDHKISPEEFDGPASHFSLFDLNQDGFISADEAPDGPPPGRKKPPSQK